VCGLAAVVISYRNRAGNLVHEILYLNENGLVDQADGT
jgi:hypothetical protein